MTSSLDYSPDYNPTSLTGYEVTSEHMRDTAGGCKTAADTINSELQTMVAFCRGIHWEGTAHDTGWDPLVTKFANAANNLNDALVNISAELYTNADNYDAAEQSGTQQLTQVGDAIPTVNLP
jgi:WXG100 family type VII secretion target